MAKWRIEFEHENKNTIHYDKSGLHCLCCPVRNWSDDLCMLQLRDDGKPIEFKSWEEQKQNCPAVCISE
jgi:hypothetical protein